MKKLQKQFEDFDKQIRIDKETPILIEKREKLKADIEANFPSECEAFGITVNKSDLRFILQGSYKIGTTISGKGVDMDYAVIMPLDTDEHDDSRLVKKAARDSLLIKNVRVPKIKEPCVTVAYYTSGEETMHIDFPIYAENNGQLFLARGKENSDNYKWEDADPEGLNDYFLDQFKGHGQLRRIVRYFKKWKQEKYSGSSNSHEVPPSIALTILACQNYTAYDADGDNDLRAFYETMKAVLDLFYVLKNSEGEITYANIRCDLPVTPYTDVLYKMRTSSKHMITFYQRLERAVSNLQQAVNLEEEHEAAKYVQKVLGTEFQIPEKNARATGVTIKGEHSFG